MTETEKREIVERVAWKMFCVHPVGLKFTQNWWKNNPGAAQHKADDVENVLEAANYFELRDLLSELANSPIIFADDRLDYVEMQVPRAAIAEALEILGLIKA